MEPTAHIQAAASPSDEELLERIARSNDRQAFEDLAYRFSKLAYNLALRLCGNAGLAEDAVQDAMVDVWLHARHFDPARGHPRSWILRIVANKTLTLRTRESREKKRIQVKRTEARIEAEAPHERPGEGRDLSSALRQTMARLSEAERQIVSMYYGAEMTQNEIARSLDMSQRTVSQRLQQSLEKLRRNLSAAGFAAALPLLEAGKLGDALLGTEAAPPGLHAGIKRALTSGANQSARITAAGTSAWWWGLAAVAVLAAGAAAWRQSLPEKTAAEPPAPPAPNASAAKPPGIEPAPTALAATERVLARWTFDKPDGTAGLSVTNGAWAWRPGDGLEGSGCMRTTTDMAVMRLDVPVQRFPVQLTLHSRPVFKSRATITEELGGKNLFCMVVWDKSKWRAIFRNLGKYSPINPRNIQWVKIRMYIAEGYSDGYSGEYHANLIAHEPEAGAKLCLAIGFPQDIDEITLSEIDPAEMPDVRAPMEALARIPAKNRVGTVDLPEVKPEVPGKKVQVVFSGPSDMNDSASRSSQ